MKTVVIDTASLIMYYVVELPDGVEIDTDLRLGMDVFASGNMVGIINSITMTSTSSIKIGVKMAQEVLGEDSGLLAHCVNACGKICIYDRYINLIVREK